MTAGLGLTSTLAAQHKHYNLNKVDNNGEQVSDSVVVIKKDLEKEYPFLKNHKEVKSYNEIHRGLDEAKKRETERRIAEFKKRQQELRRQEELERQRLAEERRQMELAKRRAQQLAQIKAEQEKIQAQSNPLLTPTQTSTSTQAQVSSTAVKGTMSLTFTYYVASCPGCSGVTATGYDVKNTVYYQGMRIIATDPSVLPTYSIIQFEHNGQIVKAIALDTGGAIKGNKIDMLVSSVEEANQLGVGTKQVEVLRYGK